jgi:hypothetical protein
MHRFNSAWLAIDGDLMAGAGHPPNALRARAAPPARLGFLTLSQLLDRPRA